MRQRTLNPAEVLVDLRKQCCLDVITLWPEWTWAIGLPTALAKRVECRDYAPPRRFLRDRGALLALHAGAHVGGRKGGPAREEGLASVLHMAKRAGMTTMGTGEKHHAAIVVIDPVEPMAFDTCEEGDKRLPGVHTPIVTSAITGIARIRHALRPWEEASRDQHGVYGWKVPDAFGWVFDYLHLETPVPTAGAQGIWRASPDLYRAVVDQISIDSTRISGFIDHKNP